MEAVIQIMDAERLLPVIDIPEEMRHSRVQITIEPVQVSAEKRETVSERILRFRKKYNHDYFIKHLKQMASEGVQFDFDVQKLIDGTETEEDQQTRFRSEKQTWAKAVGERAAGGEL